MGGVSSSDRARGLALALPEAVEQAHHGRPSFRVGRRIFATLWDDGHMNVMLDDPGIRTAAADMPECCEELFWGGRLAAVRVRLSRIREDRLAELLADAWEGKAPARLVRGGEIRP